MTLYEVSAEADFKGYYGSNGLSDGDIAGKIDLLTRDMKILATRCEGEESPAEELADLEELALLGYWRASW
jgi:hypothetical protein